MELKLIEKKDNTLLSRTEITLEGIKEAITPSYDSLKKKIAEQFSADASLIAIRHIYPQFGTTKFKVVAYIYADKNSMENLEQAAAKEEKPKAEKPAKAEQAAEKPAKAEQAAEKPAKAGSEGE
jgi:ribosomal protein S24E